MTQNRRKLKDLEETRLSNGWLKVEEVHLISICGIKRTSEIRNGLIPDTAI